MPLYLGNKKVINCTWAGLGNTYLYLGNVEVYPNITIPLPDYWINTTSITGLNDGATITNTTFKDLSENNITTNIVGTPKYKTGGQNLLSYISFNGSSDGLYVSNFTCNLWTRTIFMVLHVTNTNNTMLMEFGTNAQGGTNQFYIATQNNTSNYALVWSGNSSYTWLNYTPANFLYNLTTPIILSYKMNWVNSSSFPITSVNNVEKSIYRRGSYINKGNQTNTKNLNIFSRNGNEFFTAANFYELIFYNKTLTTEEFNTVYAYLSAKYNI